MPPMFPRTKLRGAMIGAATTVLVAGSALLTLPAQAQAQAQEQAGQVPASVARMQSRAEAQVHDFFGYYRNAILGQEPNPDYNTPAKARAEFFTKELDQELYEWAGQHNADPVFRAQNVPEAYDVALKSSDADHATVILTQEWEDGSKTYVQYRVRLSDLLIDGLTDATA